MKHFFHSRLFHIGVAIILIASTLLLIYAVASQKPVEIITATVENGPVRQLVSVSGVADAKQTAELSFPITGIVEVIRVKVGDVVAEGDIIATLKNDSLLTDRSAALAEVQKAQAELDELLSGPQQEARAVTAQTVAIKREALATTKETESRKIENAYRTLLSSSLTAYSNDGSEASVPPTISGTYTCNTEGTYKIEVYSSAAHSGYSYRLSGLETGTYSASNDQAIPFGECGLRIIFDDNSTYHNTTWYIDIPNTKSSSYTTNKNAYDLAKSQAASAIALAEEELSLAELSAKNSNAPARNEAVIQAEANVTQAQAKLARIDSEISDRVMRAPFAGTITDINVTAGETATSEPIITLLSNNEFEVTAKIPEIDIGKLVIGQSVEMMFDARPAEIQTGKISFISLKATEIDGVSYYEAYIQLDNVSDWIRSGLNADIDIILSETTDTLRIPKRFLIKENNSFAVLKQNGELYATTTIGVTLEGNDGFVAITGLNAGDILVAP